MSLLAPSAGSSLMLQALVNKTAPQDLKLKLFSNNHTPANADTAGSYTEASGFGYAAITLTGASWAVTAGNPSSITYATQTFTFTGALGNVYGYFLVQSASGIIEWAELFTGGPYLIQNNGDQITVTPLITLG